MIIESEKRPIDQLMDNAFTKMKGLIGADTVIGTPIHTENGVSIIPISKVTVGVIMGGGEFGGDKDNSVPYAGGGGTGASVVPIAFLVNDGKEIKLINLDDKSPFDKIMEIAPELLKEILGEKKCKNSSKR